MATKKYQRQEGGNFVDSLFLKIEDAEIRRDATISISDAIAELSRNEVAARVLIREMCEYVIDAEKKWREIEQMPEFKSRYTSRDAARADFLRQYYSKD